MLLYGGTQKIRVGMVAPVIAGGIKTHLSAMCRILSQRNFDVHIITSDKYRSMLTEISHKRHACLTTVDLPSRELSFYAIMPSLRSLDRRSFFRALDRYDILHVHGYTNYATDYLSLTRKIHEMPVVITFHGSLSQYSSISNRFWKTLHNKVMIKFQSFVSKFIAVSYFEKDIAARQGISDDRIEVIYNGVDAGFFEGHRSDFFEERLGIPRDVITLVYLGRLSRSKNLYSLIKATRYLLSAGRKVRLVMIGPNWGEESRLKRLSAELGISNYVLFVGEVTENEKMTALASADIFVYPALRDVFSLSVVEASASCVPVVAFASGSNNEMIVDGYTGVLARENTPLGLARAIDKLIETGDREQMGKNGREYVLKRFSWDKAVANTEEVYEAALLK